MRDCTDPLLAALAEPSLRFGADEIAEWDPAWTAWLEEHGLLVDAEPPSAMPCPACDGGHVADVHAPSERRGSLWFVCREAGRVELDAGAIVHKRIARSSFARLLATRLALSPPFREVQPGRHWSLGRMHLGDGTRTVALALGLSAPDGHRVAAHAGRGGRQIILLERGLPPDFQWPGRPPTCILLDDILGWTGADLALEPSSLHSLVEDLDRLREEAEKARAGDTKRVRKQVKEVLESMVEKEALVQAYRVHGSYTKTADALNAEGFVTNRWEVERAVKAAGGPKAVKRTDDSNSIARTVASQSRDRGGKIDLYRK